VPSVDFVTSFGFGRHGEGRSGPVGAGPSLVITDLGVLRPDPDSHELTLIATHPGVEADEVGEQTGWDLQMALKMAISEPPTYEELAILRDLKDRTRAAHTR
jgi:glutaconate CoA-transferase subunit B